MVAAGHPAPGEAARQPGCGSGEIRDFTQSGWRVSINSRAAGLGFSLPQRLTAEREGARSKLLVNAGQYGMSAELLLGAGQAQPDASHRRPPRRRYHELQTVSSSSISAIASKSAYATMVSSAARGPAGVPESEDLASGGPALKQATGTPLGAEITIKKSIPWVAAWRGKLGRAHDAARAQSHVATGLTSAQIAQIGVRLGLMYPFSWRDSAWAEGVGEKLTPVSLGRLLVRRGVSRGRGADRCRIPGC
jgi:hypothetical protein